MTRTMRMVISVVPALALWAVAAGCAPERPESVPADAQSVAKQSGHNPINFTAPHDGMVYVYDRSANQMLYTGRVERGDTLELDPRKDVVRLDGKPVLEKSLRDLNEYQVWFDEAATTAADTAAADRRAAESAAQSAAADRAAADRVAAQNAAQKAAADRAAAENAAQRAAADRAASDKAATERLAADKAATEKAAADSAAAEKAAAEKPATDKPAADKPDADK